MASLLAKRKGGWEDEKEEAEVLSVWVPVCAKPRVEVH